MFPWLYAFSEVDIRLTLLAEARENVLFQENSDVTHWWTRLERMTISTSILCDKKTAFSVVEQSLVNWSRVDKTGLVPTSN